MGPYPLRPAVPLRALVQRDARVPRRAQKMHHGFRVASGYEPGRIDRDALLPPSLQRRHGRDGNTAAANAHTGRAKPLSLQPATHGPGVVPVKRRQQNARAGRVVVVDHDTITAVHGEVDAVEQADARTAQTWKPCLPLGCGIHERQQWRPVGGMIR